MACPGAGACGGQYTANTMALAIEFLGLSPVGYNTIPATDPRKDEATREMGRSWSIFSTGTSARATSCGASRSRTPSPASPPPAAPPTPCCTSLAMAREAGIPLDIDDFDTVSARTPHRRPHARRPLRRPEVDRAGGLPVIVQRLLEAGRFTIGARVWRRRPWRDEAAAAVETPGQEVVRPPANPLKPTGGLVILKGNLAPEGCVVKLAGHERPYAPPRPGPRLRPRGGRLRRRPGAPDPRRRRGGHPLRGAARRPRHARDAGRHRGARRRGPGRARWR